MLYDLSNQIWESDHPFIPFGVSSLDFNLINNHNCKSNFVGVKLNVSLTLPSSSMVVLAFSSVIKEMNNHDNHNKFNNLPGGSDGFNGDDHGHVKLSDVNVELERNVEVARKEVRVKTVLMMLCILQTRLLQMFLISR